MHADENNLIKGGFFLDDWALRVLPKFPWQAEKCPLFPCKALQPHTFFL